MDLSFAVRINLSPYFFTASLDACLHSVTGSREHSSDRARGRYPSPSPGTVLRFLLEHQQQKAMSRLLPCPSISSERVLNMSLIFLSLYFLRKVNHFHSYFGIALKKNVSPFFLQVNGSALTLNLR